MKVDNEVKATTTPSPSSASVSNDASKSKEKDTKKAKLDLSKVPVRQYLDMTVVPHLLTGLASLARERPVNPLEFLGNYLLEKSKTSETQVE